MRNAKNEIGTSAHLELRLAGLHDTAPSKVVSCHGQFYPIDFLCYKNQDKRTTQNTLSNCFWRRHAADAAPAL